MLETIGLFFFIAGLIIGLGAVIVIDIIGFLGRNSTYWTLTAIRAHKVTKPLIWLGTWLATMGGMAFYAGEPFHGAPVYHTIIAILLILNGLFLSFAVSPYLLEREARGEESELLPKMWQRKVVCSFILSDVLWWSAVLVLVWYISPIL